MVIKSCSMRCFAWLTGSRAVAKLCQRFGDGVGSKSSGAPHRSTCPDRRHHNIDCISASSCAFQRRNTSNSLAAIRNCCRRRQPFIGAQLLERRVCRHPGRFLVTRSCTVCALLQPSYVFTTIIIMVIVTTSLLDRSE